MINRFFEALNRLSWADAPSSDVHFHVGDTGQPYACHCTAGARIV